MNKKFLLLLIIVSAILFVSCDSKQTSGNSNSSAPAEVQKNAKPVADDEIAVIEMENSAAYGTIKLELYSNIAPKMVAQFKELAKAGFYDGIAFHRINQSVIQAGDANTKTDERKPGVEEKGSDKPNVPAEFSDVPFDRGILGAARLGDDVNSANSQFFITLKREPGFDNNYTIFGKVIEGMNNVNTIAAAPQNGESPIDKIKIKTISIQPKQ